MWGTAGLGLLEGVEPTPGKLTKRYIDGDGLQAVRTQQEPTGLACLFCSPPAGAASLDQPETSFLLSSLFSLGPISVFQAGK